MEKRVPYGLLWRTGGIPRVCLCVCLRQSLAIPIFWQFINVWEVAVHNKNIDNKMRHTNIECFCFSPIVNFLPVCVCVCVGVFLCAMQPPGWPASPAFGRSSIEEEVGKQSGD